MNKSELIEEIASQCEMPKAAARRALDAMIETVIREVSSGGVVSLVGFGTFSSAKREARMGRNPRTGEKVRIPSAKVPKFKAGARFKEAVAKGRKK